MKNIKDNYIKLAVGGYSNHVESKFPIFYGGNKNTHSIGRYDRVWLDPDKCILRVPSGFSRDVMAASYDTCNGDFTEKEYRLADLYYKLSRI